MGDFLNSILLFFLIGIGIIAAIIALATGGAFVIVPVGGIIFAIVSVINSLKQSKKSSEVMEEIKEKAKNGNADYQWQLGSVYYEGLNKKGFNVSKDWDKALRWFKKAALQGLDKAQTQTGVIYHERGNNQKAFKWFRISALQGNVIGQNNIGYCYEKGFGVEKDLDKATNWYNKCINNTTDSYIKSEAKEGLNRIKKLK